MHRIIRFAMQPKIFLPSAGVVVGVVAAMTVVPAFNALFPAHAAATPPGVIGIVVIGGFLGLVVSSVALFVLYRLVLGPLGRLSKSVRSIAGSPDHSQAVTSVGDPTLDGIGTHINQLISTIKLRDETIDRHELMERNLKDWMKRRGSYELELKEARTAAEDANQTKSHFLASVSHELRTPLHTIMSYARFGERDIAEGRYDDAAEYFEVIIDSSDLLLLLLNDLLNLSKLESGKMSFNMTPTSLGDVVGCVADQCQMDLEKRNLEVVLDLQEPDTVFVDASRTLQVARNLIENAIKYTRSDTSIFVDVFTTGNHVMLRVRDQGEGVPDEELDSIFESFRQATGANIELGGVGLGLAIARQIVVSQKGRIWAENHPEGGLVVFVQFAAYDADVQPGERMSMQLEGSRTTE